MRDLHPYDELAQPVEHAARGVAALMRDVPEPGWPEFPSIAADVAEPVLTEE